MSKVGQERNIIGVENNSRRKEQNNNRNATLLYICFLLHLQMTIYISPLLLLHRRHPEQSAAGKVRAIRERRTTTARGRQKRAAAGAASEICSSAVQLTPQLSVWGRAGKRYAAAKGKSAARQHHTYKGVRGNPRAAPARQKPRSFSLSSSGGKGKGACVVVAVRRKREHSE